MPSITKATYIVQLRNCGLCGTIRQLNASDADFILLPLCGNIGLVLLEASWYVEILTPKSSLSGLL